MLPTKRAKPSVLRIHGVVKSVVKRETRASSVCKKERSCKIKRPKNIPPKRENKTFLVRSASAIASSGGRTDKKESAIETPLKLDAHQRQADASEFFFVQFALFLLHHLKAEFFVIQNDLQRTCFNDRLRDSVPFKTRR